MELSATISKPITNIFNSSMCQGLVPQLWKEGNITALRTSAFSLSVVVFLSSPSSDLHLSYDIPVLVFLLELAYFSKILGLLLAFTAISFRMFSYKCRQFAKQTG
jgi:hypothetical protein